ncbi:hypothetical protein [Maritimibacter sp. HL-12]|jgi:hypothetical protein|uniref:hypothetical protein n=1 Tax=Maritimibacter sp. HL-12 TaxID=1162418 RepID=UPI000A0F22AD|nr:hypothetical protein [Maritimibacter sp. HL-12]SMH48233.1 hypothetical protein SAMN05661107_1974 [Maritimibacter sp. HL-12]
MRISALAILALPILLAACEITPRQQCEAPYRAELRTVDAEIRDTREILRRGFRLVPARWEHGVHYCIERSGFVGLCTADDGLPMYDKRPISRAAEQAKLSTLEAERQRLSRNIAQCAVQFPE